MKIKTKNRDEIVAKSRERAEAAARLSLETQKAAKNIAEETGRRFASVDEQLATDGCLIDQLDHGLKALEERMDQIERGYIGRGIDRVKGWMSKWN